MVDLYEVQVIGHAGDGVNSDGFRIEHRFSELPQASLVMELRREMFGYYVALFGEEPAVTQVILMRLSNREVAAQLKMDKEYA